MALHAEVSSLRREAYMARIQQRELEQLQAQLGVRGASSTAVTVASVLHASPTRFQDSFVIDRGIDHGVQDATLVMSPEGIVYGSVVRTFSQTALVQTFSYPGRVTDTVVQGTTTLHLQVEGLGGGTMQVQVPRDIELSVGTPVLLPSMTTRPIGDVVEIRTRPEDAYQTVYIQAPFNARELRYVQVDGETVWQPTPTVEEALVPYGEG
jgi:cell shape-determining protein MreC